MRIGFVGLGDQGEPMARRILDAGYELAVHPRRPEQAEHLRVGGALVAGSVAELAARSDILGVCVGGDRDVEEVFDQALPHLPRGSLAVIHSTVHPDTCKRIGERARGAEVAVVDAPVSGGRQRAFDGQLTVMAGGDAAAVARVRPVLDTFAGLVVHVGPLGSGELLKLVNNYFFTAQLDLAWQAVDLLRSLDLEVGPAMRAIARSTASSTCIEWFVESGCDNVFPRHMKGRTHGAALLAKDIGLIRAIMADAGVTPAVLDARVGSALANAIASGVADDEREAEAQSGVEREGSTND